MSNQKLQPGDVIEKTGTIPQKCRTPDGIWFVRYLVRDKTGRTFHESRYFWRKKEAESWIIKNSNLGGIS